MFQNMLGGIALAVSTTAIMMEAIPGNDRPFTRYHRFMLTMAILNTFGLAFITA